MYMRSELLPLTEEECGEYLKFRLMVAGRMDPLFDEAVIPEIHHISGGICRRINKLGMLSLMEGYLRRKPHIDGEIIARCAEQL
jgi:type II secretory pathway predicted ATPase ExeA